MLGYVKLQYSRCTGAEIRHKICASLAGASQPCKRSSGAKKDRQTWTKAVMCQFTCPGASRPFRPASTNAHPICGGSAPPHWRLGRPNGWWEEWSRRLTAGRCWPQISPKFGHRQMATKRFRGGGLRRLGSSGCAAEDEAPPRVHQFRQR